MTETRPTLIVACNDLEAKEIFEIAGTLGFHCIDLELPWGGRLDGRHPALALDNIGPLVVLIELPAPEFEQRLREAGRIVEIIDHHLYIDGRGEIIDRRRPRSSLEQFVGLFGTQPLTARQRLIAANDRDSWPALIATAKAGVHVQPRNSVHTDATVLEAIWAIRREDLTYRIQDSDVLEKLVDDACVFLDTAEADGKLRVLGCGRGEVTHPELLLVRAPAAFRRVLMDALYLAHYQHRPPETTRGRRWRRAERLNTLALEALILFEDQVTGEVAQVEYSGPGHRQGLLNQLIRELTGQSRLRIWAGGGELCCFLCASAGSTSADELVRLADRWLANVLVGNRPLRRWRTQFLQVLRYPPDRKPQIDGHTSKAFDNAPVGEAVRNYLLDYMRPFLVPTVECDAAPAHSQPGMRSVTNSGFIDAQSLIIHSYAYKGVLPQFRIRWKRWNDDRQESEITTDQRPITHLKVYFVFTGMAVIEWCFQDGWPGYDAAAFAYDEVNGTNRPRSLVETLLRLPRLWRDDDGCKREEDVPPGTPASAFVGTEWDSPYPELKTDTPHVPGIDTLAELLDFNETARQCFSSFQETPHRDLTLMEPNGSETTLRFGERVQPTATRPTAWFGALVELALAPFGLSADDVEIVLDERARVVTAAACVGACPDLPEIDEREVAFARLATVESYAPTHFYDRIFALEELGRGRYNRFKMSGTDQRDSLLFAATDHSFVMLGHGWFARDVAIKHVACEYHRLFLIGLLYTSVFHYFSHELGRLSRERLIIDARIAQLDARIEAAANKGNPARSDRAERAEQWRRLDSLADEARGIQTQFIGFANGLWFDDISTQIQGRELFRLITSQLRTAETYREINDEIERTEALEAKDAKRREERRARELTVLGTFVGTLVAMGTAFAPIFDAPWFALITIPLALVIPGAVLSMTGNYRPARAFAEVCYLGADLVATACKAVCAGACGILRMIQNKLRRLNNRSQRALAPPADGDR